MLKKEPLYSLSDITIIPAVLTKISSRSECCPFRKSILGLKDYYPLITAPMDFVTQENILEFEASKISTIIPRVNKIVLSVESN